MGDGADMALSNACDEDEHYLQYQYADIGTQYEEGIVDEYGATIGIPGWGGVVSKKPSGPGNCPICSASTILKQGKFGNFYGCAKFPKCKGSRNI